MPELVMWTRATTHTRPAHKVARDGDFVTVAWWSTYASRVALEGAYVYWKLGTGLLRLARGKLYLPAGGNVLTTDEVPETPSSLEHLDRRVVTMHDVDECLRIAPARVRAQPDAVRELIALSRMLGG